MKPTQFLRRGSPSFFVFLIVIFFSINTSFGSHFRFSHISWRKVPNATNNTVEITVTEAWRRDFVGVFHYQLGDGSEFISHYVPAISTGKDRAGELFVIKRGSFVHTYPNEGPWVISAGTCCRISSLKNAADESASFQCVVDLRNENQGSPVANIPVMLQMVRGMTNRIPLAVADPDNDPLKFRLATALESSIPTIPSAAGKTLLVTTNGVLDWDPTGASNGWKYAVQVVIEENHFGGCAGRVSLDFIIEVVDVITNRPPVVSGNSGPFTLSVGEPFSALFSAVDPEGGTISFSHQGLPPRALLFPTNGTTSSSPLQINFQWTPTPQDAGSAYALALVFVDATGLQTYFPLSLRVSGNQPPSIVCPAIIEIDCVGNQGASLSLNAQVSDPEGAPLTFSWQVGSGPVQQKFVAANGDTNAPQTVSFTQTFPPGIHQVHFTVSDGALSSSCVLTVAANPGNAPNLAPVAKCKPVIVQSSSDTSVAIVDPGLLNDGSTDPDGDQLSYSLRPSGPFAIGSNVVVFAATDSRGASSLSQTSIMVVDQTPPVLRTPSDLVFRTDPQKAFALPKNIGWAQASDNWGISALIRIIPPVLTIGTNSIQWQATDLAGNIAQASQTITVVDVEPPILIPPSTKIIRAATGENLVRGIALGSASAYDNDLVAWITNSAPPEFLLGTNFVLWTASDRSGNTNGCFQMIIVVPAE